MKNVCLFDVFLLCCLAGIRFTGKETCIDKTETIVTAHIIACHEQSPYLC